MADKFLSMVITQYELPDYIMSECGPHFHG